MTPKENVLAVLNHEKREWVPSYYDMLSVGFGSLTGPAFEKGPAGGGLDGFGVNWLTPSSGGGAPVPEPGKFLLDSDTIVDWKKLVKFPDISKFNWEDDAKYALSRGNADIQAVDFGSGNGPFERLGALMGFEEALISIAEEPEACFDLMNAIADYKCDVAACAKKYYNADTFTNYDDIATQNGLFMSPASYRKLIKPAHTKMNQAVLDLGMIPIQHTCGKADSLIQDYIDTKATAWTSVQPSNDIVNLLKTYGDKICIMGGYDTNGAPGFEAATLEEIDADVKRCMDMYSFSNSYIFFGFRTINTTDPQEKANAYKPMIESARRHGKTINS